MRAGPADQPKMCTRFAIGLIQQFPHLSYLLLCDYATPMEAQLYIYMYQLGESSNYWSSSEWEISFAGLVEFCAVTVPMQMSTAVYIYQDVFSGLFQFENSYVICKGSL